jgi:hypothetical protein
VFPVCRKTNRGVKRAQQISDRRPDQREIGPQTGAGTASAHARRGGGAERSQRPLLFVDVDGVVSLFGFDPTAPPAGAPQMVDGIIHWVGAHAGARLARLAERYELVWATGWEEKANEYLVRVLDMPAPLPVLSFENAVFGTAHWKLEAIGTYAGDRPAAWIDDSLDDRCVEWARRRSAPTLLVEPESAVGITDEHVELLLRWAEEVSAGDRP